MTGIFESLLKPLLSTIDDGVVVKISYGNPVGDLSAVSVDEGSESLFRQLISEEVPGVITLRGTLILRPMEDFINCDNKDQSLDSLLKQIVKQDTLGTKFLMIGLPDSQVIQKSTQTISLQIGDNLIEHTHSVPIRMVSVIKDDEAVEISWRRDPQGSILVNVGENVPDAEVNLIGFN